MIKLLVGAVILIIVVLIIRYFISDYDKCYSEREADGYAIFSCCKGMVGGTKQTNYLSEMCIGCPYLVLLEEKKC